jgi:hypothetical protein
MRVRVRTQTAAFHPASGRLADGPHDQQEQADPLDPAIVAAARGLVGEFLAADRMQGSVELSDSVLWVVRETDVEYPELGPELFGPFATIDEARAWLSKRSEGYQRVGLVGLAWELLPIREPE